MTYLQEQGLQQPDEKRKKLLRRNVALVLANGVFAGMIFMLPVALLIYQDRGLTFRDFLLLEAVFATTMIVMEVPSGWLSDVWSRRRTLILSAACEAIGFLVILLSEGFATMLCAEIMIGIAVSLLSGTNSAMLYDTLLELGEEDQARRIEGKRHAFSLYSVGGAALVGGFMYKTYPDLPLIMTVLAMVFAGVTAFLMVEPLRKKVTAHKNPLVDMVQTIGFAMRGHRDIAGIMIMSAVLFSGTKLLLWVQQPYYQMLEIDAQWFGIFAAIGFFLGGLGGHFGHIIDGRFRNIPVLLSFMGIIALFCLTAALAPGHHAIPLLLSGSMIFGFAMPRVVSALNKRVDGSRRATIISANSMAVQMMAIPLFVMLGWVESKAGITTALTGLAIIQICGGICALLLVRQINRAQDKGAEQTA